MRTIITIQRPYGSRIGAWASKQSEVLKNRDELYKSIEEYKKKYQEKIMFQDLLIGLDGFLTPNEIEFWLRWKKQNT